MKWTTKKLRQLKSSNYTKKLSMLTCYDYQTACALNESNIDLVLVGDSLGNVILGYNTTCQVTLQEMVIFGTAVKKGTPNKFTIIDMPFGTYASEELAIKNGIELFQKTQAEALKIEGANPQTLKSIQALINTGIPVVGHIGLTPQFYHQQGGYFTHGKTLDEKTTLLEQAKKLEQVGVSLLVLECITEELATEITKNISIPTIGIGSGPHCDGQVLVINDLLGNGPKAPPKFCSPVKNLYQDKLDAIQLYVDQINTIPHSTPEKDQYENLYS